MFINSSAFKKLIKGAYGNGRLIVGATEQEYFIEGGAWIIRILKKALPKKEKAAVIELTGELPEAGEVFRASKGEPNQYEIPYNSVWNIRENCMKATEHMTVTKSLYQSDRTFRIIQHQGTQRCIPVDERFISMLDSSAVRDDERMPAGPLAVSADSKIIYWFNESMALAVGGIDVNEDDREFHEYIMLLENTELPEKNIF